MQQKQTMRFTSDEIHQQSQNINLPIGMGHNDNVEAYFNDS